MIKTLGKELKLNEACFILTDSAVTANQQKAVYVQKRTQTVSPEETEKITRNERIHSHFSYHSVGNSNSIHN